MIGTNPAADSSLMGSSQTPLTSPGSMPLQSTLELPSPRQMRSPQPQDAPFGGHVQTPQDATLPASPSDRVHDLVNLGNLSLNQPTAAPVPAPCSNSQELSSLNPFDAVTTHENHKGAVSHVPAMGSPDASFANGGAWSSPVVNGLQEAQIETLSPKEAISYLPSPTAMATRQAQTNSSANIVSQQGPDPFSGIVPFP